MLYTNAWVINMATYKEISISKGYPIFIVIPYIGGIKFFKYDFTPLETIDKIWRYLGETGEKTIYMEAPASYEDGIYDMILNEKIGDQPLKDLVKQNHIEVPTEYDPESFCKLTKELFNHCLLFLVTCTSIYDNITSLTADTEMNMTVDEFDDLMTNDLKAFFNQAIKSLLHFRAKTDPDYIYKEGDYMKRLKEVLEYIKRTKKFQNREGGYTSI